MAAWAVGEGGVVLKTADGGRTWTRQAGPSAALYGLAPVGASALAVGANGAIRLLP
jgi:photosystem II stability/assembly factor-like uncharacterized protein